MSTPKNYRPIALLETLSKLLEKVVTARLLHKAGEHNLIPQAQFGGKDITSCTDAGLCMVHDIRAAWKSNKAASFLTLDVSATAQPNFASTRHSMSALPTAAMSASLRAPHYPHPQAHSFAYIDDFTILAYSHSHQENINVITDIIKNINHVAIKLGLEFELPKSDLIHFIRSPKTPHSNPSLTFSHSGTDTTISPKDVVRWLGFYLDRRLNFKEHIQTMAIKAKATLGWFANASPTPRMDSQIVENLARKLRSIPAHAEVARRLPPEWDSSTERQHNPKSPITFAASLSHPDIEFITPYLVHPSKPNIPWPEQLEIEHKSPAPLKKAAAKIIQNESTKLKATTWETPSLVSQTGMPEPSTASPRSASLHRIAMCLNSAARIAEQVQAKRIIIYCDNQAAVKAISSLHRHPAQYASRTFHQHAQQFLEKDTSRHITVKWLPGHSKIDGNELADEAAKGSEMLQPTPVFNRTITWARTRATKRATSSWGKVWNEHIISRPDSDTFIPRPPALKLHPIFNRPTYPRNVQCRLVQFLTGHGFYGAYSARFHPHIDPQCQCGEPSQTPEHLLMFCPETEKYRHIITDASPEHSWKEISEHCRDWRQALRPRPYVLMTDPYALTAATLQSLGHIVYHALMAPVFGPCGHPVLTTSLARSSLMPSAGTTNPSPHAAARRATADDIQELQTKYTLLRARFKISKKPTQQIGNFAPRIQIPSDKVATSPSANHGVDELKAQVLSLALQSNDPNTFLKSVVDGENPLDETDRNGGNALLPLGSTHTDTEMNPEQLQLQLRDCQPMKVNCLHEGVIAPVWGD
ncbi:Reverse transcriptase (RNA-dependent DNA polymerase) [Rhizoctonia solani]|uniref:Reverse transcriptase (RNA-dependent DNA polymerase) n=1 Tax=Rhizoctonia solani TaxID=456999 RepID=A0A8H7IHI7_9AGAM|nr:Reverse transcriptase (RNA-dependent DNA polymerase) [Rhizoctonia solani]